MPRRSSASTSPTSASAASARSRAAVGATQREVIAVWEFVKSNLNPYPTAAFTAAVSGDSLARRSSAPTS